MKSDHELIQAYVDDGSDSAFAELVRRHAGTVYGSALRQLQNPHAAEEICQTVFILLSKKASSLRSGTLLIGWLMQATRYAVLDHRKTEHRRFQRETAAFEMTTLNSDATQDEESTLWMQLSPRLDEAVGDLGELDRQAIWLRFFQHKSLAEIGQALGCAEDAARKRVARALERLQQELRKRGVSSPLSSLPAVLGTQLSPAAPPQLIEATLGAIAKPTASSLVLAEQVAKQFALATLKSWLAPVSRADSCFVEPFGQSTSSNRIRVRQPWKRWPAIIGGRVFRVRTPSMSCFENFAKTRWRAITKRWRRSASFP